MTDEHVRLAAEMRGEGLHEIDRAMPAAGAADSHGEIGAVVVLEAGEPLGDEAPDVFQHLAAFGVGGEELDHQVLDDYYDLIKTFERLTGCPVVVNTSFNVRGEPIVCAPAEAYRCFMRTDMDVLVMENCVLFKKAQPPFVETENWREQYELD